MSNNASPYVGPRPFEATDQKKFFGRDREAGDLFSMVFAHPVLLLYAQSGAGKTSLLNAKLVPMLQDEAFEVYPVARLRVATPAGIRLEDTANPYAFCAMLNWASAWNEDPDSLVDITLADYMAAHPHPLDDLQEPRPRALIFDQFEELFTAYPEHWEHREGFIRQIADAAESDPLVRVLIVIREDFLAQLDPFAPLMPERLQARFRMERLQAPAARQAIEGPLAGTHREYAEGVPTLLVEELRRVRVQDAQGKVVEMTGPYVEPVQLQVVCSSIWTNLPQEVATITQEHLRAFGDVDDALRSFYESAIRDAAQITQTSEKTLRRWVENVLITKLGTRSTIYRGPDTTGGLSNRVIDVLDDLHLIRAERRAGTRWYELTHDRLIEPIHASNRAWEDRRLRRTIARLLTAGAVAAVVTALIILAVWFSRPPSLTEYEAGATQTAFVATAQAQERDNILTARIRQALAEHETGEALTLALAALDTVQAPSEALKKAITTAAFAPGTRQHFDYDVAVRDVDISADGKMAAFGLGNGDLMLWDIEANEEIKWMESYRNRLTSAAFSPDGEYVLAGFRDATAVLWHVESGTYSTYEEHDLAVTEVAFCPDSSCALTASLDGSVIVWDAAYAPDSNIRLQVRYRFEAHNEPVYSLAVAPMPVTVYDQENLMQQGPPPTKDVYLAVSGGGSGSLLMWEIPTGTIQQTFVNDNEDVLSIAFDPVSRAESYDTEFHYILTGAEDGTVRLWRTDNNHNIGVWENHADEVTAVALSPDGHMALSGAADGELIMWDVESGQKLRSLKGHTDEIGGLVFTPDGLHALAGSADRSARLWDVDSRPAARTLEPKEGEVLSVALSPDGSRALAGMETHTVRLWDVEAGEEIRRLVGHGDYITHVAFSPDGTKALSASRDITAIHWDLESGEIINQFGTDGFILAAAYTSAGPLAVSEYEESSLAIWDAQTGEAMHTLSGHDVFITAAAIAPDGKTVITGDSDGTVIVWDVESGERLYETAFDASIRALAAGSGGMYAAADEETVWRLSVDAENLIEVSELTRRAAAHLAFDASGQSLALNALDRSILVYDLKEPTPLIVTDSILPNALALAEPHILTGSSDGAIRLWPVDPPLDEVLAWVEANRDAHRMTPEECAASDLPLDCPTPGPTATASSFPTASQTPFPSPTQEIATLPACPNAPPTRLVGVRQARVVPNTPPNNLRSDPEGGKVIGEIIGGDTFDITDGPVCGPQNGLMWWQVVYEGQEGWTAEGKDAAYWVEPLPDER